MRRIVFALLLIQLSATGFSQHKTTAQKVDSLLNLMTLEEKIGQMNQFSDDGSVTGPATPGDNKYEQVRRGEIGSMLNCKGAERTRSWQELAMQSRLKIPLLFGLDVVHGYKTTFPIPLAEAATWDLEAITLSARIAAIEASASGIHWTFAPMVDIARDPRWGRIMEGAGEDTYLGSLVARARVKGFQGERLDDLTTLMACAKHFAAYGAAVGGRDYNSVDMSERMLREVYLPPFRAAADAGVATFMNSFNDINGVPATGNSFLQREILKGEWGFDGFVVSDWGSIGEMVNHGNVTDDYEAALNAITAGSDMDMESRCYKNYLARLVSEGRIDIALIDDAVGRILTMKFEMGLFDDPFRYCDQDRQEAALNNPDHPAAARAIASKSIVLLKNSPAPGMDRPVLPLDNSVKTIAFIGPLVKAVEDNKGFWDVNVPGIDNSFIVTQWEGLISRAGNDTRVLYARGCEIEGDNRDGFREAVRIAKKADVVILSIGESRNMSGEARSRSNISLPGVQEELLKELVATGKPVVVLVNAGRPLVFGYASENATAILYTWWLGSEAGNAIADVLFGDYNPSAKLPVTFPRSVGQVPIYYNHLNTGRPVTDDNDHVYKSAYTDLSIYPRYEFGYGMSYTTFDYGNLQLSSREMADSSVIEISLTITNRGKYDGEEVVQLYLRDKVASVSRPVRELKDFSKVMVPSGESRVVSFIIDRDKLSFYNIDMKRVAEPGEFGLMIGSSSQDIRLMEDFVLLR